MPSVFIHGKKDKIVPINHSRSLFQKYPGQTKIHELELDHNDPRPKWLKQEIKTYFQHKFQEAIKKKEFNNHLADKLKEKVDNDDLDAKKAHDLIKKLVYADGNSTPFKGGKENKGNGSSGKKMQGFINNKFTERTVTSAGDSSDSDDDGYSGRQPQMNFKKQTSQFHYRDDSSDGEETPRVAKKIGNHRNESDSEDSSDEGHAYNGPRVSNMADFLKFQRKKMPILHNTLKHHRGSSLEQKDEDLGPKGFYSKRNATNYNSDTE